MERPSSLAEELAFASIAIVVVVGGAHLLGRLFDRQGQIFTPGQEPPRPPLGEAGLGEAPVDEDNPFE